jgi:antirestriction protein ArdC
MRIANLYEQVTAKIVAELEAGAVPWTKPWRSSHSGSVMPQNFVTRRPYSGINIPILWGAAIGAGYERHHWLTFKQAKALGAHVRKGERGTIVVFTRTLSVGDEDDRQTVSMLRTYSVFNVAQIDGLADQELEPEPLDDGIARVKSFVAATQADVRIGGSEAAYVPSRDYIKMPPLMAFQNASSFFATLLHECGHWAGHEKRLNRDLSHRFGTRAYAAEELIAELTSAFLCAHLGIEGELRHAGYIADWIALLSDDPRAIFTAASQASRAADYLRRFSEGQIDANAA